MHIAVAFDLKICQYFFQDEPEITPEIAPAAAVVEDPKSKKKKEKEKKEKPKKEKKEKPKKEKKEKTPKKGKDVEPKVEAQAEPVAESAPEPAPTPVPETRVESPRKPPPRPRSSKMATCRVLLLDGSDAEYEVDVSILFKF